MSEKELNKENGQLKDAEVITIKKSDQGKKFIKL